VSESGRFASIEIARGAGDVGQVTALLDVTEGSAVDGFDFRGLSKEPVRSARPVKCGVATCFPQLLIELA